MTHVISLLVENHQGVLSRISGLFSGRGYNLESLTAGATTDPTVSRITLVCGGDDSIIDQIKKQLNRLVDVIKVMDLTQTRTVNRELALVKVFAKPDRRGEILQIVEAFSGQVMDMGRNALVVEIAGPAQKIEDVIALLQDYGVQEVVRSGTIAIERSPKKKPSRSSPQS